MVLLSFKITEVFFCIVFLKLLSNHPQGTDFFHGVSPLSLVGSQCVPAIYWTGSPAPFSAPLSASCITSGLSMGVRSLAGRASPPLYIIFSVVLVLSILGHLKFHTSVLEASSLAFTKHLLGFAGIHLPYHVVTYLFEAEFTSLKNLAFHCADTLPFPFSMKAPFRISCNVCGCPLRGTHICLKFIPTY